MVEDSCTHHEPVGRPIRDKLRRLLTIAHTETRDIAGLIPTHLEHVLHTLDVSTALEDVEESNTHYGSLSELKEGLTSVRDDLSSSSTHPNTAKAIKILATAYNCIITPQRTVNLIVTKHCPLPDRVYTLAGTVLTAILLCANLPTECWFICKKFALMKLQYDRGCVCAFKDGLDTVMYGGRVFARGVNTNGQVGVGSGAPFVNQLTRVPGMARVTHLFYGDCTVFALTSAHRIFGWGANNYGQVGVDSRRGTIDHPRPVVLPRDCNVYLARSSRHSSFFATNVGWFSSGRNMYLQLALGHRQFVRCPQRVHVTQETEMISDIYSNYDSTFAWTGKGTIVACGWNEQGQSGTGSLDHLIGTWTKVHFPTDPDSGPDDAPPSIPEPPFFPEHIYVSRCSAFFYAARTVYCCGWNAVRQLPVDSRDDFIRTPVKIPYEVDNLVCNAGSTIFLSNDTLYGVGDNTCGQLFPTGSERIVRPTPLRLPVTARRLCLCSAQLLGEVKGTLFVLGVNDEWYVQGYNNFGLSGIGSLEYQVGWTRVPVPQGTIDIISCTHATFFFTEEGVFAAGDNGGRRLGCASEKFKLPCPTRIVEMTPELPSAFNWAVRDTQVLEVDP